MTGAEAMPPKRVILDRIDAAAVGARATELRALLTDAAQRGGHGNEPELLVASKYFTPAVIPALVAAGLTLLGENRADELPDKQAAVAGRPVQWDYIGELQSRKAASIAPLVSRIHTLASTSAVRKLQAYAERDGVVPELLIQVNVAGEFAKGGVTAADLPELLALAEGLPVRGLMTMPPLAPSPQDSRPWFAALRGLARKHGLSQLSMGTSQDALIAAEEGATVVRVGGVLHDDAAWERLVRSVS